MMSILRCMSRIIQYTLIFCIPLVSNAAPPITPENSHYNIYSDTAAELFWTRTTNVSVQGYEITRNGEVLGVFDALSYFDDTLNPRVEYTYTITAVGSDGLRSGISSLSFRTPQYEDTIAILKRDIYSLKQEVQLLESLLSGGFRSPVPQTGQSVSLQSGDDGDYQAGVPWPDPRFTVNVQADDDLNENGICDDAETCNGTVTDNLTGLIWLQNANCFGGQSWPDAVDVANNLAGDGSSNCGLSDNSQVGDWRLPNVKELQSLLDYGHSFPTPLLPADHPFDDIQLGGVDGFSPFYYWTSTSTGPNTNGVYTVSISVGWVERWSLTANIDVGPFVWPVRGGR